MDFNKVIFEELRDLHPTLLQNDTKWLFLRRVDFWKWEKDEQSAHPQGLIHSELVYRHRCTRLKICVGRGVYKLFGQNHKGGLSFFGFYCIFTNKCFKNLPWGYFVIPTYPPVHTPIPNNCDLAKQLSVTGCGCL
jgi:hypothetical protein